MIRSLLLALLLLVITVSAAPAQVSGALAVFPDELMGLTPLQLTRAITSRGMTLVTSSYAVTNPTTGATICTVSTAAGETGYVLATRYGATVNSRADVYSGSTDKYYTTFVLANTDSGWKWNPAWSLVSAGASSSLSIRAPIAYTGVVSASILVGIVK